MFSNFLLKSNGNVEYCKREREREKIPGGREREREMKRKEKRHYCHTNYLPNNADDYWSN